MANPSADVGLQMQLITYSGSAAQFPSLHGCREVWKHSFISPPTPRFTLLGHWSLLKSCVSLKTATGAACGTSANTDMAVVKEKSRGEENRYQCQLTEWQDDFPPSNIIWGPHKMGVSRWTNWNVKLSDGPIAAAIQVRWKSKATRAQSFDQLTWVSLDHRKRQGTGS